MSSYGRIHTTFKWFGVQRPQQIGISRRSQAATNRNLSPVGVLSFDLSLIKTQDAKKWHIPICCGLSTCSRPVTGRKAAGRRFHWSACGTLWGPCFDSFMFFAAARSDHSICTGQKKYVSVYVHRCRKIYLSVYVHRWRRHLHLSDRPFMTSLSGLLHIPLLTI